MKKTIKPSATPVEYIMNGGTFSYECLGEDGKNLDDPAVWCSVAIEFSHSGNETDETDFDVRLIYGKTPDYADLNRLFMDFVSENKYKFEDIVITGLRVTNMAPTIEELERV